MQHTFLNQARKTLALAALLAAHALPAAAAPVLSVTPASTTATAGELLSVAVAAGDVADLFSFNFSLSYDGQLLSLLSITEGNFLATAGATFFVPGLIDDAAGIASFTGGSLLGPVPGATGSGDLAVFTFRALQQGVAAADLSDVLLLDSSANDIAAATQVGRIAINAANSVDEPGVLLLLALAAPAGWVGGRARRRAAAQAA